MQEIRVTHFGLGPIGAGVIRDMKGRGLLKLVAAVDVDPDKAGRDVAEVAGIPGQVGVRVTTSAKEALGVKSDVAVICTVSSLEGMMPLLEQVIDAGLPVVSTCEELVFPWLARPDLARRIDEKARQRGVQVLGVGVNPGYIMDYLPLVLSSPCRRIDRVEVYRIQDASHRRLPFQKKIGAGYNLEEYARLRDAGKIKHVGLVDSIQMVACGLGWKLDRVEEIIEPIEATRQVSSPQITVPRGHAAGTRQVGRGLVGGRERIYMEMRMSLGEPDPRDTVIIVGEPDIESTIRGGLHGDVATTSLVVNAIPVVSRAHPGLVIMTDIPTLTCLAEVTAS
ncbi:MAG: dihydrodipicolinate reductase [Deltaproteobacteria bacterium]|nr:dihydrodipicolinate reductase [Deltaproteobacteria bacterium]MBW2306992.1 dihydrodipicolinate reductase [Deltaproteobacteria bacterium]